MQFALTWEQQQLRSAVADFVERRLLPLEAEVRPQEITAQQLEALQEDVKGLGLWLMDLPPELGGPGLSLLERCIVYEQIGRATVLPFRSHALFGPRVGQILSQCVGEQREKYLDRVIAGEIKVCFAQTEPDAGSDPAAISTRAVLKGDKYVLNGTKRYITGGHDADFAQVVCRTGDADGHSALSVLMVPMDAPGVTVLRRQQTMMGDAPAEIAFEDVVVPIEDRIGEEGKGFAMGQEWLIDGRLKGQAARALGMGARALEMLLDYANTRETFGRPLAARQAVQFMVADSAIDLETARLLVYATAARFDAGEDIRNESYMAKVHSVEAGYRVVDRALQVHGGLGLTLEFPLEYWFRQLRSMRITEGAHEVMRWALGRNLLRAAG